MTGNKYIEKERLSVAASLFHLVLALNTVNKNINNMTGHADNE